MFRTIDIIYHTSLCSSYYKTEKGRELNQFLCQINHNVTMYSLKKLSMIINYTGGVCVEFRVPKNRKSVPIRKEDFMFAVGVRGDTNYENDLFQKSLNIHPYSERCGIMMRFVHSA